MKDLCGDQVDFDNMPFYGLAEVKVGGRSCVISQSGFSGEAGYEIYLRNATLYAEDMWNAVLEQEKNIILWLLLLLTIEEFKQEFFLGDKIWINNIILFNVI